MFKRVGLLSAILLALCCHVVGDELAVSLYVVAEPVSVQRVGTTTAIPLPVNALASVGSGDMLQTGENGRLLLQFADSGSVLLLPNTELIILQFSEVENGIQTMLALDGVALFDSFDAQLELGTSDFQMTGATGNFGVWALQDDRQGVIVDAGTVKLDVLPSELNTGEAWIPFLGEEVIVATEARNPAQIIGESIGCEAMVDTIENEGLLIRAGNGQGYESLDLLQENSTALLIGIMDDQTRVRVQFDSGFGWAEALGIPNNCPDLIVYSGVQLEENIRIFNVVDIELPFFEPYYGTSVSNRLFFPQLE